MFEPGAVEGIALASSGIPRRIDRIAHHTLLAAAGDQAQRVDIRPVEASSQEAGP